MPRMENYDPGSLMVIDRKCFILQSSLLPLLAIFGQKLTRTRRGFCLENGRRIFPSQMKPCAFLGEVMSTPIKTATADQTLEEVNHHFEIVSGLPVIDENRRCIGVLSKRDKAKASNGIKSKVGEVMSSPAITLSVQKTALDAAALMLKKKIHRIPILNEKQQVA